MCDCEALRKEISALKNDRHSLRQKLENALLNQPHYRRQLDQLSKARKALKEQNHNLRMVAHLYEVAKKRIRYLEEDE